MTEGFTSDERARLEPYFTNLEGPVFALTNLPEVVKGALFARYSRTTKSIRRLFLDEFAKDVEGFAVTGHVGTERAERLYDNVFFDAQLGGVHLACEQASQLLAKAIEWGRLAAYLEQSTRYMRYDDKPGGAVAPHRPAGASRARRSSASTTTSPPARSRRTAACSSRSSSLRRAVPEDRGATRTSSTARRSRRRRATRSACSCRPARARTSACTPTGRRSR